MRFCRLQQAADVRGGGLKTPIVYYGGKQRLAKRICALISAREWQTYTETFCGGAAVFFALQEAFPKKRRFVLNDKNELIANFYEVAKTPALHRKLIALSERRGIYAQSHFSRSCAVMGGAAADNVEKAWAVFYHFTCGFGGIIRTGSRQTVGIDKNSDNDRMVRKFHNKSALLECTADALRNAYIMNHDSITAARKFDTARTVHYFDPPYINTDQGHYRGYTAGDFARLLEFCGECKGRFILSHYDNPQLIAAAEKHGWEIRRIDMRFSANAKVKQARKRTELLVYNFAADVGNPITPKPPAAPLSAAG